MVLSCGLLLTACGSDSDDGAQDTTDTGAAGTSDATSADTGAEDTATLDTAVADTEVESDDTAVADTAPDVEVMEDTEVEEDTVEGPCAVDWISLEANDGPPVEIFAYEASRVDATEVVPGQSGSAVCSRPGVKPWVGLTLEQARVACSRVRARLCTGDEWDLGCRGADRAIFPYGDTYDPDACNVLEGPDGCIEGECQDVPTGSYPMCVSALGAWDMSGNVSEWVDQTHPSRDEYGVRGGSYLSANDNTIRCRNAQVWRAPDYLDTTIGFRCCRDLR